jgi:hypothetical protein
MRGAPKKARLRKQSRAYPAALALIKRGIEVVPVVRHGKAGVANWDKLKVTPENAAYHFSGEQNLGVRLGAASGGLVDIDLDCQEAVAISQRLLPPTDMISGRAGNPCSHWFYRSDLHESEKSASIQYRDLDGTVICELRTGGDGAAALTVVHPSVHPSGELIEWFEDGEPANVCGDALKRAIAKCASASLLSRHWPAEGARHNVALTLDGFLTRLDWSKEERQQFIEVVATVAGDDEVKDRINVSNRTEQKLADSKKVRGFPAMREAFGKDVAALIAMWLGYAGFENEVLLAEMNAKFTVVQDGGKVFVLRFDLQVQTRGDGRVVHQRLVPTFMSFGDFYNYYKNKVVWIDNGKGGSRPESLGKWWAGHPERRTVEGLTFRPGAAVGELVEGRLNLWRGFGVEPAAGDWSLMQQHIKEVLAAGDEEAAAYVENWLAWAVQHPAERAQVALVFKGGRGTGKGTLGNAMCHLFGQHATHISSVDHLAGRFNAHLRDAVLLFADEAYWPGDKGGEGTLKRLITEPTLFIEAKGRDGVTVTNMLHVLMASNEGWMVPAGEHERRYAVFQVSEAKRQDDDWFTPLYHQLEAGGYAAMLYEFLRRDLGDWHPRRIPMTEALREQQLQSLEPLDAWVLGLLEDGMLPEGEGVELPNVALSRSKPDFDGRNPRNGLYDLARQQHPKLKYMDDQVLAAQLKRWGCKPWRNSQARGWEFPPLAELRVLWERKYPGWKWRHPDLTDWQDDDNTSFDTNPKKAKDDTRPAHKKW